MPAMRRSLVPLLGLVLALSGCRSLHMPSFPGSKPAFSQQDLREELADFANHFHLLVAQAADAIHDATTDPSIRKRTLLWKLQIIPLVQQAALEPNPQEAYVSLLTLTVMMRQYISDGAARDAFREHQPIAVEAARELESELLGIGSRFLGDAEAARVQQDVEEFVASRPIAGQEFAMQAVRRTLAVVESTNVFQRVVSVPLSPFRALEGVGDSATEIRNFNATAREFVQSVERLPEQVRWQVELLLYDVEERSSTTSALDSLDLLSKSAGRVSESFARLPEDTRALLAESGDTLARLEQVLASARELSGPLLETSQQIERASAAWASVLGPAEGAEREPAGRPFDIREWQDAAREIGTTAERLETLLEALRATSDARIAETALAPVTAAVERADLATRSWIDLAAWRIAQLMLAGVALGLGYRWLASRVTPR
jgi:hypothetical protein